MTHFDRSGADPSPPLNSSSQASVHAGWGGAGAAALVWNHVERKRRNARATMAIHDLTNGCRSAFLGWFSRGSGQLRTEHVASQLALPARDDQGSDAVADHIDEAAEHAHKAIDPED